MKSKASFKASLRFSIVGMMTYLISNLGGKLLALNELFENETV
tara:strand:+ start:342 stop:470 length:129 start_codon:yes stop_codon:yes gene_type:complete